MTSLRRSFATWDLTTLNPQAPLTTNVKVHIKLGDKSKTIHHSIDSLAPIRILKREIEPHAYQLYIETVEDPRDVSGRHSRYFARSSSPIGGADSDSDYNSENELSPTNAYTNDLFLKSLMVYCGEKLMEDYECMNDYHPVKELTVQIDLNMLLLNNETI